MNFADILRTFFLLCIVGVHAKQPREINLCSNNAKLTKSLRCVPKNVFVNILPDFKEVNPKIAVYVVRVKRCLGFNGRDQCVPHTSVNVTVKVMQGNTCQKYLVEQHTKCKTKVIQKENRPRNCPAGKRWNNRKSKCECYSQCTTGSVFDQKTCRCVLNGNTNDVTNIS